MVIKVIELIMVIKVIKVIMVIRSVTCQSVTSLGPLIIRPLFGKVHNIYIAYYKLII